MTGARCVTCGTVSTSGQRFCATCGSTLPDEAATAVLPVVQGRPCAGCGANVPPELRFCTSCGRAAGVPAPYVAPQAPPLPRRSGPGPWVWVLSVAVVLALVGVCAAWAVTRGDDQNTASDGSRADPDETTTDDADQDGPTATPSSVSEPATASAAPPDPVPTGGAHCWDRSTGSTSTRARTRRGERASSGCSVDVGPVLLGREGDRRVSARRVLGVRRHARRWLACATQLLAVGDERPGLRPLHRLPRCADGGHEQVRRAAIYRWNGPSTVSTNGP